MDERKCWPDIKVVDIEALDNYILRSTFNDGKITEYDMRKSIDKGIVFKPLEDLSFFKKVHLEDGIPVWSDAIDISCETLYYEGEEE